MTGRVLFFLNNACASQPAHTAVARLRQVAHEALVLPQRRDSARQVRARAPRPLCLHLQLPRRAAPWCCSWLPRECRGWCCVLACTTARSFGSNSDSMCAKACMLIVYHYDMRVLVLFLAAMHEPEPVDEPPAERTRKASHARANTAVGSLKLRRLVSVDTEASTSVDASKRLAWALLGHQHSWARTTLNYDVHCKIGNGCETRSPIITQNIMHRMTVNGTNRVPRTKTPKLHTTVGEQSGMKSLHCTIIASQHCH